MNWSSDSPVERSVVPAAPGVCALGAAAVPAKEQAPALSGDEELVALCVQGDHDAWGRLIDKYRNLIFSIPVRHGFSRDDAADIFQDVCLKLLWELPRVREPRALAAWLIKVTARECSRWRREQLPCGTMEPDENMPGADPDAPREMLAELQREQTLRDAIGELAARCRSLVEMLFFNEPPVPYDEVARRLGLATGSIGFIRMRCLKRLRRALEERNFE
jgi:RNA polymerase sigma factor (sigma-70 family)